MIHLNVASLLAELDGHSLLKGSSGRSGFYGSRKRRYRGSDDHIHRLVVRKIGALDLRPDPKTVPAVQTEVVTATQPCLVGEFVKLIFTAAQRVVNHAWPHVGQDDQLNHVIRQKVRVRPASVFPFLDANHTSSFANFWILRQAAAISWMSSSSPRSAG